MSLTYQTYLDEIARIAATDQSDSNFSAITPGMIDYAEQRIYRELDLLAARVADSTATTSGSGNRQFTLPTTSGTFRTVTAVNIITPANTSLAEGGVRNSIPCVPRSFVDFVATTNGGRPKFYCVKDATTLLLGPWPDLLYYVEVVGTMRPTPLSQTNSSTFLTTYLPDLFVAASMVFYSGFMRNFGSQADDPKMAQSWESQYQTLFASANAEETRRKYCLMVSTP